jgi:hypothetical protein
MDVPVHGKCHLCQEMKPVFECEMCGHWLCHECQPRAFVRGVAAFKALVGKREEGCCGP